MSSMPSESRDAFTALVEDLRPRLHRYCARMVGSALDGEDVVQDALARAALHFDAALVREPRAWMFRVAHNAALDFLRHRSLERRVFVAAEEGQEAEAVEAVDPHAAAEATAAALATFMQLPFAQRSAVILADVLGHALHEIAETLETTVPAVKAALHRGRTRLRELGRAPAPPREPVLPPHLFQLAQQYAQRFNARDFDGLRALLSEEVRLQVAGRVDVKGRSEVSGYFGNYARLQGLRAQPAALEGRAGLWVHEAGSAEAYAIVLEWDEAGQLTAIRDFRYARYVGEALR